MEREEKERRNSYFSEEDLPKEWFASLVVDVFLNFTRVIVFTVDFCITFPFLFPFPFHFPFSSLL